MFAECGAAVQRPARRTLSPALLEARCIVATMGENPDWACGLSTAAGRSGDGDESCE